MLTGTQNDSVDELYGLCMKSAWAEYDRPLSVAKENYCSDRMARDHVGIQMIFGAYGWQLFLITWGFILIPLALFWIIAGYNAAAWALTITAFCLGIFVGAENTMHGRFKVPFLSGHHHLIHHTASR
jgi:hypothetical protein